MLPARRGFRWGAVFWTAVARTGAARARAWRHQSDRGSVRAQREPRLSRAGVCLRRRAGACRRRRARGARAGAAGGDRKTASARRRRAAERRPRREPGHRAGSAEARAPEPATGACARHAARPCRRHHRRRRHDQAGRARIDDAARSGGAPAGLVGRATRLDRHRRQPARLDRRAVRVRGVAAADPAIGAALWRTAGRARHDPADAPRHRPCRHHRRHGGERQPDPAGARPRSSRRNCRSGSAKASSTACSPRGLDSPRSTSRARCRSPLCRGRRWAISRKTCCASATRRSDY